MCLSVVIHCSLQLFMNDLKMKAPVRATSRYRAAEGSGTDRFASDPTNSRKRPSTEFIIEYLLLDSILAI